MVILVADEDVTAQAKGTSLPTVYDLGPQNGQIDTDDILCGLDGTAISHETLSKAVQVLDGGHSPAVAAVALVEGTENKFPTSHSAMLSMSCEGGASRNLFVKKVSAVAMGQKPWADRRRTLAYARNEARFYQEFAADFKARGVSIPTCALIDNRVDVLLGDSELAAPPGDEPGEDLLRTGGVTLFLQCVEGYDQTSPISEDQAMAALRGLAGMHAAAWEDRPLLSRAAERLQRFGGSFALSIRNPKELTKLCPNWDRFAEIFEPMNAELFARPSVKQLGARLLAWSGWVARQLEARADCAGATMVHGDYKAMNVFLPRHEGQTGMLIDFASTGVGYGMADVAMLLAHSLRPETLQGGGEQRLIDGYLAALSEALGPERRAPDRAVLMRQYHLGVVDYGRFMVSRFWGDASPERFAERAGRANATLPNRDSGAALAFVERIDAALQRFEDEGLGPRL